MEVLLAGRFRFVLCGRRQQQDSSDRHDEKYCLFSGAKFCCRMYGGLRQGIIDFSPHRNPQVSAAEVVHLRKSMGASSKRRQASSDNFCSGERGNPDEPRSGESRAGEFSITLGFDNLVIMKTSGSAFEGYIQDSLTTLPPAKDRLLGTAVRANWKLRHSMWPFRLARKDPRNSADNICRTREQVGTAHLYAMGNAVLEELTRLRTSN